MKNQKDENMKKMKKRIPDIHKLLFTVEEVSQALSCSEKKVRTLIKKGEIKTVKLSERMTRVKRFDLEIYVNNLYK